MEEYQKLVNQNQEMKMTIKTLAETVSKLVSEFHTMSRSVNMRAVSEAITNLNDKNTILDSRVKYLEKNMNNN